MELLCNDVSPWLGASLKSVLENFVEITTFSFHYYIQWNLQWSMDFLMNAKHPRARPWWWDVECLYEIKYKSTLPPVAVVLSTKSCDIELWYIEPITDSFIHKAWVSGAKRGAKRRCRAQTHCSRGSLSVNKGLLKRCLYRNTRTIYPSLQWHRKPKWHLFWSCWYLSLIFWYD